MTIRTAVVVASDIKVGDWVCFERPELEMVGTARLVLSVDTFGSRGRIRFGFQLDEYYYADRDATYTLLIGG